MSSNKKRKISAQIHSNDNRSSMTSMAAAADRVALFKSRTPSIPLGLVYNKTSPSTSFAESAVVMECFIDFCCPFSKRIWDRLTTEVYEHYLPKTGGKCPLKIVFHQVPQPWHPQSTMLHEVALAALIAGGEKSYQTMYQELFNIRDKFTDAVTYDMSRTQIYESLVLGTAKNVGIPEKTLIELLSLDTSNGQKNSGNHTTQALKWYVKQHRQRGIHVSPTCAINGVEVNTSSGWSLDEWRTLLDPLVAVVNN